MEREKKSVRWETKKPTESSNLKGRKSQQISVKPIKKKRESAHIIRNKTRNISTNTANILDNRRISHIPKERGRLIDLQRYPSVASHMCALIGGPGPQPRLHCSLAGNQTSDPLLCGMMPNQLSYTTQGRLIDLMR